MFSSCEATRAEARSADRSDVECTAVDPSQSDSDGKPEPPKKASLRYAFEFWFSILVVSIGVPVGAFTDVCPGRERSCVLLERELDTLRPLLRTE